MDIGDFVIRWTIRLSLACYGAVVLGRLWPIRRPGWSRASRILWTLGCAFFLTHVATAFHFFHHWSHQHALDHTARETGRLIGWEFGEGIYFSYLFAILWAADVALCWSSRGTAWRRAPARGALQIYLFFIAFNGAVVFEGGATRVAGAVACVVFAALVIRRAFGETSPTEADASQS